MRMDVIEIPNTSYCYEARMQQDFKNFADRVQDLRKQGSLSPEVLYRIRKYFRIKTIYHSNAIEGNILDVGETRAVVEAGLTITGIPLKDQAEARNLSHALDFFEEIAQSHTDPITATDIRQIHGLVLQGLSDQAGRYRSVPVEISGSDYKPPGHESVPAHMEEFGSWLSTVSTPNEHEFASTSGLIAAAAAHTWFVTIHPFIDGNGRVARLLLNLLLMRYGYPIAIISKEDRIRYYDALEESQASNLTPFIVLVAECIGESLEEYELAAKEQEEHSEWARRIGEKFSQPARLRAQNEYEVWKNAMELLKSHLRQTVDAVNEGAYEYKLHFKDFGNLEFEKYSALRINESAKRTWFLRIDFLKGDVTARYLFFFGSARKQMRERCLVTLHIAREEPMNSYHYEPIEYMKAEHLPSTVEVGYEIKKERFVIRPRNGRPRMSSVEEFGRQFFERVIEGLTKT